MSMTGPGTSGLPLFAPPAPDPVQAVHDAAEAEHAEFLDRVRKLLLGLFGGTELVISTDEAWHWMERYGVKLPEGASPNVLGTLFSGWNRAEPVSWTRSKREGSHGNLLRTWRIR